MIGGQQGDPTLADCEVLVASWYQRGEQESGSRADFLEVSNSYIHPGGPACEQLAVPRPCLIELPPSLIRLLL